MTMYLALTGAPPYKARTAAAVIEAHQQGLIGHVSDRCRSPIPPAFAAVVMRCLATSPEARYADGRALADAIDAAA